MNIKNTDFINTLNKINQIFKGIYNSGDKFQNVWNCQDGRFIMHHQTQLPSFIEVMLDTESLVTAKGAKTAKGLMYDEFLSSIHSQNISINSISYFNELKELDKESTEIELRDNNIYFNGKVITLPYEKDSTIFDKKPEDLIETFEMDRETIDTIVALKNKPFNMVFNFDERKIQLNADTTDMNYLNVKTALKFLPYVVETKEKSGCNVTVKIYETPCEYTYDLIFEVNQYKINAKGVVNPEPISVRYGVRILEL